MEKNQKVELIGKPSIDRPWMKYYPESISKLQVPELSLNEYLKANCPGMDMVAMHYYGRDVSWERFFMKVDMVAKSMSAMGIKEGDQVPVFYRSVPEFIVMLLAAEKIGASLVCRDNTLQENIDAVKEAGAKIIFVHDFLPKAEAEEYKKQAGVETIVSLSPYHAAEKDKMPEHIINEIDSFYTDGILSGDGVMTWEEFLEKGKNYTGEVEVKKDVNRPLFRAYTSGSTGASKQVIHSAYTMIGIIAQMAFYGSAGDFRPTWLLTNLPPCLIAVVVSMILVPLCSNKLLILDPFCNVNDLDLEMMRYRPNCWPLIPMFIELLMRSDRIPEDYDMSHLFAAGVGCEAFNNGQIRRAQEFLKAHNCKAVFSIGYGQSEAGSNCTLPCLEHPIGNGNSGIPMPLTVMSIFEPGTHKEVGYNKLGEICKTGFGNMLGYDRQEATEKALQKHEDGNVWLHTGDIGYMTEDGIVFALTRGDVRRVGGGRLIDLNMENKIIDAEIDGIIDAFFVVDEDFENKGYFLPYLYVVLEDGYTIDDIREDVADALEDFEYPAQIIQLPERPFFHYKTNRIGLKAQLRAAAN